MKRQGFTVLQAIVILAIVMLTIVIIVAAYLLPVFFHPKTSAHRAYCQSNLKQIALGFKQYIQDYDGKHPTARNSDSLIESNNWAGQIQPYLKSTQTFQCRLDTNATDTQKSSYGYNSRISRLNNSKVKHPAHVILNFEVVADPNNWTQTGSTPTAVTASTRHLEGSNFSFVDGHVKWLKPGKVGTSTNGNPTFIPY